MTDLNSLVIFAKVVEANSFSDADRRLKMPTSTVSRRVADLEDQLGVRLLERSTRFLRVTDVGSELSALQELTGHKNTRQRLRIMAFELREIFMDGNKFRCLRGHAAALKFGS